MYQLDFSHLFIYYVYIWNAKLKWKKKKPVYMAPHWFDIEHLFDKDPKCKVKLKQSKCLSIETK